MEEKIDRQKFLAPPYPLTYSTRERVLVEENNDSVLISVESVYPAFHIGPPKPIRVTKACGPTATWRLIGNGTTNSRGELYFNLSKFLNCHNVNFDDLGSLANSNFLGPVPLFLATAHSAEPVFLTFELVDISEIPVPPQSLGQLPAIFIPYPALDVNVIVRSWRHDGSRAPAVQFSWMAIAEKTAFLTRSERNTASLQEGGCVFLKACPERSEGSK